MFKLPSDAAVSVLFVHGDWLSDGSGLPRCVVTVLVFTFEVGCVCVERGGVHVMFEWVVSQSY